MRFGHDRAVWNTFPDLAAAALVTAPTIAPDLDGLAGATDRLLHRARRRSDKTPQSALPQIQAWRRAYAAMGLKPTQYRCAAESLLRRLRKDGSLPRVHPLVDLCNAASAAYAIPVAVLDVEQIDGPLVVRHARGDEHYETFGGGRESPERGEIVYADASGYAHSRRWCTRQSGRSAVGPGTRQALIVAEAQHDSGPADVAALVAEMSEAMSGAMGAPVDSATLTRAAAVVDLAT